MTSVPLPCPICGTEHRDDCPNKFGRVVSESCSCVDGCNECDWVGTRLWTSGGHKKVRSLNRPARGFFATLTPEQQARALAYTGPDSHGDPAFLITPAPAASGKPENENA